MEVSSSNNDLWGPGAAAFPHHDTPFTPRIVECLPDKPFHIDEAVWGIGGLVQLAWGFCQVPYSGHQIRGNTVHEESV